MKKVHDAASLTCHSRIKMQRAKLWPEPASVVDQLRLSWLREIRECGPSVAAEYAAQGFMLRSGCSHDEGHEMVRRAWGMLGIQVQDVDRR